MIALTVPIGRTKLSKLSAPIEWIPSLVEVFIGRMQSVAAFWAATRGTAGLTIVTAPTITMIAADASRRARRRACATGDPIESLLRPPLGRRHGSVPGSCAFCTRLVPSGRHQRSDARTLPFRPERPRRPAPEGPDRDGPRQRWIRSVEDGGAHHRPSAGRRLPRVGRLSAIGSCSRRRGGPPLEHPLLAVLLVDLRSRADEPEAGREGQRRSVVR